MILEESLSHEPILERMARIFQRGRLAHAYLFTGPYDVGKGETALAFAQLINCDANEDKSLTTPCRECASCIKVQKAVHPDIHIIEKEFGEHIKIEDIRALMEQSRLRPFLARIKVFLIRNIEGLTLESANALLKTLEEPNASSLLLLTSSAPEKVLDTIRSRCQTVHFAPSTQERLAHRLVSQYHIKSEDAHFLAYFAEGCLGRARKLHEQSLVDFKNKALQQFLDSSDAEPFIKELVKDKQRTKLFLDVLLSWIRDGILTKKQESAGRLIHLDRVSEVEQFALRHSFEDLIKIEEQVVETMRLLADNLNVKLPLMIIKELLWER